MPTPCDEPIAYATVLVEVGELSDAEAEVRRVLQQRPTHPEALSLLAKIKHMRGELTAAFTCWAQAQSLSPEDGVVQLRLNSLLQLAQDPERGAGEFLAVGRSHLWRKPAEVLELEAALRLFVARRPSEARAACHRLAQRHRGRDRDLFGLATMAEAWIAELAGDLVGARAILEELGRERGFESDTDRALALARIYEQIGEPPDLEKAVHVCEYLARTLSADESVSTLGRLASLCRALGRGEYAARYAQMFLEAFQLRMHRVSLQTATAVAARCYVPLASLPKIHFTSVAAPPSPPPRQRALLRLVAGDVEPASVILERGREPLDRKYAADLAWLRGDADQGLRRSLALLAESPDDRHVLGWLLDRVDHAATLAAVERHLADPAHRTAARQTLEAAVREMPLSARYRRRLATLQRLSGDEEAGRRSAERAEALAAAALQRQSTVGRALSAAVYHFAGRAKGLVHEIWATRRPAANGQGGVLDEVLGNLTPDLHQGVRNTFLSVREYARAKFPHQTVRLMDWNYGYKITKEDEPSGGLSAGLPTALAFLSVFLDRPLPQDVASSGVLVADAHDVLVVRPVGDVECKVRGAYNRNLRLVLLPEENRAALSDSAQVPAAVSAEIVRYVADLDQAAELCFGPDLWLA